MRITNLDEGQKVLNYRNIAKRCPNFVLKLFFINYKVEIKDMFYLILTRGSSIRNESGF